MRLFVWEDVYKRQAFNKYYNFRKLPEALSFFNGKRFVPFVVILRSAIAAIVLAIVWPVIQDVYKRQLLEPQLSMNQKWFTTT